MLAVHVLHKRPPTSLGTRGKVPLEIRSEIYGYLFSPNCYIMTTDPRIFPFNPDILNMLSTSHAVRSEALDELSNKTFTLECHVPDRRIFYQKTKVDIPNTILRNQIEHMRDVQVILDARYLCGYSRGIIFWKEPQMDPTAFDWPSIARDNKAPATHLLLALPHVLAGAAENRRGRNATIILQGSYQVFRFPVTKPGEQTFTDLVAVFKNFETLTLRARATMESDFWSKDYEDLSGQSQARVTRAIRQYIEVRAKKIKDAFGPNKWTEDRSVEPGVLWSETAEFHPSAHLAATQRRTRNVSKKDKPAQKVETGLNEGVS